MNSTTWVFEPAHTHIGFSVRHLGLTSTPGVFKRFAAQLHFDEQVIESSRLRFEVEVASIDTALEVRDDHLRGADWFDVQSYPVAVFESRAVHRAADDRYLVAGDLTLRGISLPVTLQAVLTGRASNPWTQAPVVGFEAGGAISRSAFGMGMFPAALSDEVRLRIAAELTHA